MIQKHSLCFSSGVHAQSKRKSHCKNTISHSLSKTNRHLVASPIKNANVCVVEGYKNILR
jgi:hypothetical protein